jgi:hypothetical protein
MGKAGADRKHPKCDVELTDGNDTVGLMLINGRGMNDPLAIQRSPYPRASTKINTGAGKYDDLELPYKSIVQDDWVGGRAGLNFEDDATRYLDNFRAWTDQDKQICCGPQETYCNDYGAYRTNFQAMPGSVNFTALMGVNAYIARTITATTYNSYKIAALVRRVGTPSDYLILSIYNDSAGQPGTYLFSGHVHLTEVTDNVSQLREETIEFPPGGEITGATTIWVVAYQHSGTPTVDDHWEIGTDPDTTVTTTMKSSNGTVWTAASQELYYRLIDNHDYNFKFFEYKRAVYAFDTKHGYLFLNGDRGVADSNATHPHRLIDATKDWTTNEWAGCTVLITKGTGASDQQPWRTIASNTSGLGTSWLEVTPDWDTVHDTTTEYVILGSNKWKYIMTIATVTDIAVADEIVYFAREVLTVAKYNACNVAGVWHDDYISSEVTAVANKLRAINSPIGWELWGSQFDYEQTGARIWKAKVPPVYSDTGYLYDLVQVLDDCKGIWDEQVVTNVTVSHHNSGIVVMTSPGFDGASDVCSKAIPATDITKGDRIGMMIMSLDDLHEGDIKLKLDDTPLLGRDYLPDNVWHYDTEVLPSKLVHFTSYLRPTQVYVYDADATVKDNYNKVDNAKDLPYSGTFTCSLETADYLYISSDQPAKGYYLDILTKSTGSCTITLQIYNGIDWVDATIDNSGAFNTNLTKWINITSSTAGWNPGCLSTVPTGKSVTEATFLPADHWNARIKVSASSAGLVINEIGVLGVGYSEVPETERWIDMLNAYDDSESAYIHEGRYYDLSSIYVGCAKRFDRIKVNMGATVNAIGGTLSAFYFTGKEWLGLTLTDYPGMGSGKVFDSDGDITFTMPTRWQKGCLPFEQTTLTNDYFYIKLIIDVTQASNYYLTDDLKIQKVTLEDSTSYEQFRYTSLDQAKDGDLSTYRYFTLKNEDWLYVMFNSKYNKIVWDFTATVNNNAATMVSQYFNGERWIDLSITDYTASGSATLATDAHATYPGEMQFTIPYGWQPVEIGGETGYAIRLSPTADLDRVGVYSIYVANDDAQSLDVPALVAAQWSYVSMPISPNVNPNPDDSKIVSIGLYLVHKGAHSIYIRSVDLITDVLPKFILGNSRVNSIEAYGDTVTNPWIFTESMVYEIQTQNDNSVVPIPLREISALRSETNGVAHTVSNVYLVFNLGQYIEKYYQHNLDDIGPNRDEGLPSNRQGDPTCLLSFPGRIFLSVDAKTTGYSTIMLQREGGWHEIYRAPYGCPIHDMIVQVVPNMSTRLWISQEYDILYVPMPTDTWNPKNDSDFRYTHESVITTGWITAGFMDILKFWNTVKLYTENLSGTDQYIVCEYQTEDGGLETCTDWTEIEDTFDTSPFQEIEVSDDNITARRIRFRLKLITTSNLESPIVKANVIETLLRFPVKQSYSFTFRLEDSPEDYSGRKDDTTRAEDIAEILDAWADAPTVLTFRCNYSPYDDKEVVLEPISYKPLQVDSNDALYEKHVGTATLLEI